METKIALSAFSALSQESRLNVFRLLVKAGPAGLSAGTIAETLSISPSTLSFHLKELEMSGLTSSERDGRSIIHKADYAGIRDVVEFLMADCCNGDPRLCGPYIVNRPAPKAAGQEECC